jgi:hypothetical protein
MKKSKRNNNNRKQQQVARISKPPYYKQQVTRKFLVRTQLSGAILGLTLTSTQVFGLLPCMAITAITGVFLSNQARIRRVSIWGPVATAGTPVSVELKWSDQPGFAGGLASPPCTTGDTSVSFDRPAYATIRPPKDSYFHTWLQTNNGSTMIVITAPAGSILDFEMDALIDDLGALTATRALVGATPGTLYHLIATFSGAQTLTAVAPLNSV